MNPRYPAVARRAGHRCEYCRAPEVIFNFPFEVEHIVPISLEGLDDETNLAMACRACNVRKADHVAGIDETTRTSVRLFNPRADRWEEHFRFETGTRAIQGLTPVGHSTIWRSQMNNPAQLEARQQWVRLGLFLDD